MSDSETRTSQRDILLWKLHKGSEVASCYLGLDGGASIVRVQIELPEVLVTIVQPGLGERDEIPAANNWLGVLTKQGWVPVADPMAVLPKPDRRRPTVTVRDVADCLQRSDAAVGRGA